MFLQNSHFQCEEEAATALMCHFLFEGLTPLQFEPPEVFFGKSVTVTCSPPPSDLGFGPNTTAEWRLNGVIILKDNLHSFSTRNGAATLTISNFFVTDNGERTDFYNLDYSYDHHHYY